MTDTSPTPEATQQVPDAPVTADAPTVEETAPEGTEEAAEGGPETEPADPVHELLGHLRIAPTEDAVQSVEEWVERHFGMGEPEAAPVGESDTPAGADPPA